MTKHKPQNQHVEELVKASQRVPSDSIWTHYKNPDLHYKITGHAILEATDEVAVLYQAQYGEQLTFVRPISNFLANVDVEGTRIARFARAQAQKLGQ